jgi:Na+-driven multidrug efflux pump
MFRLAIVSIVGNALLDYLFFLVMGPIGVPVATVCLRFALGFVYFGVARDVVKSYVAVVVGQTLGSARSV